MKRVFGLLTLALTAIPILTLSNLVVLGQQKNTSISGNVLVVDGDGIVMQDMRIRLLGIDAPETDQICLDEKCGRWTCGIEARDRLAQYVDSRKITCVGDNKDRYGRTLATCFIDGKNLNAWIVSEGFALAYTQYSSAYVDQEKAAHSARRGLWRGAFIAPWDQRDSRKHPKILGEAQCSNQADLFEVRGAPSAECTIKGNINKGERIYFVQGQRHYGRVKISGSGERWFCSEEEAVAAGWRKAQR